MIESWPTPANPTLLVDSLDADAIERQLTELDRQAKALRVLLRAARVRKRKAPEQEDKAEVARGR